MQCFGKRRSDKILDLDVIKDVFNNLKESKFMQNFTKELSEYVENNIENDSGNRVTSEKGDFMNLDELITKFRSEVLVERANILQNYANETKENGEAYYIYDNASNGDSYNLTVCDASRSHEVITIKKEDLPDGAKLGSILRKNGDSFTLDSNATQEVGKEIDDMIQEKLEEQDKYLESKRIDGHVYEVGEKGDGRIWLYDLNNETNGGKEGIEEIDFPNDLYDSAQEGDKFVYKDGEYKRL